jgi:predicted ABC-type ATPase
VARPRIFVLAGTNGAGKSSIGGAMIRAAGADYFNPDEAAAAILKANPGAAQEDASSAAWHEGKRLLERAIAERLDFAFETTLGGSSMTALLTQAAAAGFELRIWYVALRDPELHVARVRARVGKGGHDIPEAQIRKRYDTSRRNLISLLGVATEVKVFDNSDEADPEAGFAPEPFLVLHVKANRVLYRCPLERCPTWAKPIMMAALAPST